MAAIKRFFEKRKLEVKFKKAGPGQRLGDESARPSSSASGHGSRGYQPPQRVSGGGAASAAAAEAAMARMSQPKPGG